jgi:hypothetical protein
MVVLGVLITRVPSAQTRSRGQWGSLGERVRADEDELGYLDLFCARWVFLAGVGRQPQRFRRTSPKALSLSTFPPGIRAVGRRPPVTGFWTFAI